MALTQLDNTIIKGAIAVFSERASAAPNVFENYVQNVSSNSNKETHAFMGMVPVPKQLLGERVIQQMVDFKFDITNKTYEVTIAIPREDFEDQQVDRINGRFAEIGEAFGQHKDSLFRDLLANGASTAPQFNDADGVAWPTFFDDTATIGESSALDNNITTNITTPAAPTTTEMKTSITDMVAQLRTMEDDQGRVGYNSLAATKLRLLVPPEHQFAAMEAVNASIVSNTSNVHAGIAEVDVLDYLTTNTTHYLAAVGATRMPFILQQRDPLEVIVDTDPSRVAERNAVLVLTRERFDMTYGDPRRIIRQVFT